ncbi:IgGFc-binding protein-like [Patiria miniata]|uniref:IgGFc-binding protein N-terminal domain-containing protein n=1 Tax=Patiria miniata TaxID=46514 RepID=A0A913ZMF9_PATMI|nr:IgGFc-binding protein-like [Patiria miniata]
MDHSLAHHILCVVVLFFAIPEKPASAVAQCSGKTQGKHFIIGFTDNLVVYQNTRRPSIFISTMSDQLTTVNMSSNFQIDGSPFTEDLILQPRGSQQTDIPDEFTMLGSERSLKAIEIVASNEISVHGFLNQRTTTDGFLGIPVNSLGQQYVVVTAAPLISSQFAVIGTEDSTSVQVTLRGGTSFEGQTYFAGDIVKFMVNKLESVHIWAGKNSPDDLTGSIIQTDKPVAAFSGNHCANQPGTFCDTLVEQLVPVRSWGKEHIYTAARSDDENTYRIVAYCNETTLTIPGYEDISLEPGDFWQGSLSGSGLISASQPILVMQQLASINNIVVDPSLTQVPAVQHFGYEVGFLTPANAGHDPNGFFNYINIVVKSDSRSTLTINGSPITGTGVHESPVPHTDYTSITVELPKGGGVYFVEQTDPQSSSFTAVVYGYEEYLSYAYAAGLVLPLTSTCPDIPETTTVSPTTTDRKKCKKCIGYNFRSRSHTNNKPTFSWRRFRGADL